MKFNKSLYSKIALIKAAYNYTDRAYVHLDTDETYYYVSMEPKEGCQAVKEQEFANEMLAQSARHEIYLQTKNIRELLLARSMASSLVADPKAMNTNSEAGEFSEDSILQDWFAGDENYGD